MNRFIVEQKLTAFVNQYRIFSVDESGDKADLMGFAQQKRLAFKEQITVYTDETKQSELFSIKAEKVMDVHGKFFVIDPQDGQIGAVRKVFKQSLLRSTYQILHDDDAPAVTIRESSMFIAVLRRIWGFIPFADSIPFFVKYHFDFLVDSAVVARYTKTTRFRDHYRFEPQDTAALQDVDVRVLIAQALLLDVLQGR